MCKAVFYTGYDRFRSRRGDLFVLPSSLPQREKSTSAIFGRRHPVRVSYEDTPGSGQTRRIPTGIEHILLEEQPDPERSRTCSHGGTTGHCACAG
jgi:hypothetical protein